MVTRGNEASALGTVARRAAREFALALVAALGVVACSGPQSGPAPAASSSASSDTLPFAPRLSDRCGPFPCARLERAADALPLVAPASGDSAVRVLAIGEAHLQADAAHVESPTVRFMEELLPALAPRASDIVVEAWISEGKCGAAEATARRTGEEIKASQASSNQAEFLQLASQAGALKVTPWPLRVTCEEYAAIAAAGAEDVGAMMGAIATHTARRLAALDAAKSTDAGRPLLLAYGGLLHNDADPPPGREPWSFAAAVRGAVPGRYVELDLVVPESIADTPAWQGLGWPEAYDATQMGARPMLFQTGADSFALVLEAGRLRAKVAPTGSAAPSAAPTGSASAGASAAPWGLSERPRPSPSAGPAATD